MKLSLSLYAIVSAVLLCGCGKGIVKTDDVLQGGIEKSDNRGSVQSVDVKADTKSPPKIVAHSFRVVLFAFDSYLLTDSAKAVIDRAIKRAGGVATVALVGGACPIGDEEYNYRLGEKRANAVAAYIKSAHSGVSVVGVSSVGEHKLVDASNAGYYRNRRCEITINATR